MTIKKRAKDFREAGAILEEIKDMLDKKVLVELWKNLSYEYTPVCSGYAAANWYVSPNLPRTKSIHGEPPEWQEDFKGCVKSYSPNKQAQADVLKYTKKYRKWYVTNTAPYISQLNEGYSKKAPAKFVEAAVFEVVAKANGMGYI